MCPNMPYYNVLPRVVLMRTTRFTTFSICRCKVSWSGIVQFVSYTSEFKDGGEESEEDEELGE